MQSQTDTSDRHLNVSSNSTLNFSKVAPNWILGLIWFKKGKFEVPIFIIKLVNQQQIEDSTASEI